MPEEIDYRKADSIIVRADTFEKRIPEAAKEFIRRDLSISTVDDETIATCSRFDLETRQTAWIRYCTFHLVHDNINLLLNIACYGGDDYEEWQRRAVPMVMLHSEKTTACNIDTVATLFPELEEEIQKARRVLQERKQT